MVSNVRSLTRSASLGWADLLVIQCTARRSRIFRMVQASKVGLEVINETAVCGQHEAHVFFAFFLTLLQSARREAGPLGNLCMPSRSLSSPCQTLVFSLSPRFVSCFQTRSLSCASSIVELLLRARIPRGARTLPFLWTVQAPRGAASFNFFLLLQCARTH